MFQFYDAFAELVDYSSNLPKVNILDIEISRNRIQERAIEIWENTGKDRTIEEFGTFQVFDSGLFPSILGMDWLTELELQINDKLETEGYPLKVSIRQLHINSFPTATYEVIVLDNPDYEALDPIWTGLVENQGLLEAR